LGWRPVPVVSSAIGWLARSQEPVMEQLLIGRGPATRDEAAFERALYVIRRRAERWAVAEGTQADPTWFAIASCSARTVVYKGMLKADQLSEYFPDLSDPGMESALALVHSRYSTNTLPQWGLAQPFHLLAHNGEINTLQGNVNWLRARQPRMRSAVLKDDLAKVTPLEFEGLSDSAVLDQALELLVRAGRILPHALLMLVPEAYEGRDDLDPALRAFYQYHRCLVEPWDGPASIAFSDGTLIGATLDRNGLRPSRYVITHDDMVVMASEVGVLPIPPEEVRRKGRLQPGKMFLVDTGSGRIIGDDEFKAEISRRQPYQLWVEQNHLGLDDLPEPEAPPEPDPSGLLPRQQAFGYTWEDLFRVLLPMAQDGKEPVSSMGNDTPLAVLSRRSQLLYNYFKQMFAQVTNPPIDPIREKIVMNTESLLGCEANLLDETPEHARLLRLESPTLHDADLARIRALRRPGFEVRTLSMLFDRAAGEGGLADAMERLCAEASEAVQGGATILVLSDRGVDAEHVPVPALLATAGVHHHLIRAGLRTRCGLVIETGEAREVHHFALLIGYGASAVNPYMVFETFRGLARDRMLLDPQGNPLDPSQAVKNYATSIDQGLLKIFSKMGISTLMSYRGAQIFEAIGLNRDLVARYFTGTPSRIEGIGLDVVAQESLRRHEVAFPGVPVPEEPELDGGGELMWRRRGEHHMWNPETIQKLQHAVKKAEFASYKEFAHASNDESRQLCTLRGLL
ncbi:MAG: glutamate synthase subunit alpha, partial [Planctomycetaceae bacterium]|nr:glutamate synthase subunit alpha [Planctomycetaceae bacterium]